MLVFILGIMLVVVIKEIDIFSHKWPVTIQKWSIFLPIYCDGEFVQGNNEEFKVVVLIFSVDLELLLVFFYYLEGKIYNFYLFSSTLQ